MGEGASAIAGMEVIRGVLILAAAGIAPFALYAIWETGVVKERWISPIHLEPEGKDGNQREQRKGALV